MVKRYRRPDLQPRGAVTEQLATAVDDGRRIQARAQLRSYRFQRRGQVQVVTVEPAKDPAGCTSETLIDGCRLAAVRIGAPKGKVTLVSGDDVRRFIRAARVQQQDLQLGIVLRNQALQSRAEEAPLVVGRNDDADARQHG